MRPLGLALLMSVVIGVNGWLPPASPPAEAACAAPPKGRPTSIGCRWRAAAADAVSGDWSAALDLVDLARTLKLEHPTGSILRAAAIKNPVAAMRGALAELEVLGGEKTDLPVVSPQGDPAVRLHLAITRAIVANHDTLLARLGAVAGELTSLGAPDGVALPSRTALLANRLIALLDPARGRREAWRGWRDAKRRGDSRLRLGYRLTLGAIAGSAEQRSTWTRPVLEAHERQGSGREVFVALAQLPAAPGTGRAVARCSSIRPTTAYLAVDCLLTALSWRMADGDLREAGELFRRASLSEWPEGRMLHARAAPDVLPLLRLRGAWAEHAHIRSRAEVELDSHRQVDLTRWLRAERIAALRLSGRLEEAAKLVAAFLREDPEAEVLRLESARVARARGRPLDSADLLADPPAQTAGDASGLLAFAELEPKLLGRSEWGELSSGPTVPGLDDDTWQRILAGRRAEAVGDVRAALAAYRAAAATLPDRSERRTPLQGLLQVAIEDRYWAAAVALGGAGALRNRLAEVGDSEDPALSHLGDGDLLVALRVVDGRVLALRVTTRGAALRDLGMSASEFRRRLQLLASLLRSRPGGTGWESVAERLGRLIFTGENGAALADSVDRVFVVADPRLPAVPYDLLAGAVSSAESDAPVFMHAATMTGLHDAFHREMRTGSAAVFIPRFGSHAIREAREVERALDADVFLGRAATVTSFRRSAATARILHFGGHSDSAAFALGESALTLARTPTLPARLGYREIVATPLDGALVVLMGCETAGTGTPSNDLAEAFLLAGSRAVVGNLWAIDDRDAAALTEVFYAEGGPEQGPAALQRAKRRLRDRYPERTSLWAGLVWHGAPPADPD